VGVATNNISLQIVENEKILDRIDRISDDSHRMY
jgi:hypothetical protein